MNFGLDKQIERLVEVLAASALLQANNRDMAALEKLREHAFPDEVAEKINNINNLPMASKEVKGICCVVNCLNTHKDVEMVESGTGETIICLSCLEGE